MTLQKKLAVGFGIFFLLFMASAAVIPLVVDVDQYRPRLVDLANRQLNGKVELGALKLSLWGQVKVRIGGLKLLDSAGSSVLSVDDARFVLPFSSILAGSPLFTLEMSQPSISVSKGKDGELNVLKLVKLPNAAGAQSRAEPQPSASGSSAPSEIVLPGIVARARLGIRIRNGSLSYSDATQATQAKVSGLDVDWSNLSLSRPSQLRVGLVLDTRVSDLASVRGPLSLKLDLQPVSQAGTVGALAGSLEVDASNLEISAAELFRKAAGVPVRVSAKFGADPTEIRLDDLSAVFQQAVVGASGRVKLGSGDPSVAIQVESQEIQLKPFEEMVEMLKPFALSGSVKLRAKLEGPSSALRYSGAVQVSKFGFSMAQFKAPPEVTGSIAFSTDRLDSFDLKLSAPGSDIQAQGSLIGFLSPQLSLKVRSASLDLDRWLDWDAASAAEAAPATPAAGKAGTQAKPAAAEAEDFDRMLDPLRTNSIAMALKGRIDASFASIRAMKAEITDLNASAEIKPGLSFILERASLKGYGGSIQAKAAVDLRPAQPTYSFSGQLKGLDLKKAVESQFAFLKNTLFGSLSASIQASGSSIDPVKAMGRLSMQGDFAVSQARFASIDIGRMAVDGINEALERAAQKVPVLKGRRLGKHKGEDSRYEVIRSKFSMSGGRFSAPDFMAVAEKNAGLDMKGSLKVDLLKGDLDARFEVTDTYDLTGARAIDAEVAGQKVEGVLAEKGKPVRFPLSVGCKLASPCPSYTELPEHFAKVVGTNLAQGAVAGAKSEAKKKVFEAVKKAKLPGGLKKFLR